MGNATKKQTRRSLLYIKSCILGIIVTGGNEVVNKNFKNTAATPLRHDPSRLLTSQQADSPSDSIIKSIRQHHQEHPTTSSRASNSIIKSIQRHQQKHPTTSSGASNAIIKSIQQHQQKHPTTSTGASNAIIKSIQQHQQKHPTTSTGASNSIIKSI
ncbi:hypothetical protein E4U19_006692 [Claviceps sp. Clav32 group G5]|nr:hypothetical protein E4U19_006692 [Claviceps sp. Clav32 group G5]